MKLHYDKKIQSSALSRFENHSHTEKPYLSKELLFLDHLETKYYRFFFICHFHKTAILMEKDTESCSIMSEEFMQLLKQLKTVLHEMHYLRSSYVI